MAPVQVTVLQIVEPMNNAKVMAYRHQHVNLVIVVRPEQVCMQIHVVKEVTERIH